MTHTYRSSESERKSKWKPKALYMSDSILWYKELHNIAGTILNKYILENTSNFILRETKSFIKNNIYWWEIIMQSCWIDKTKYSFWINVEFEEQNWKRNGLTLFTCQNQNTSSQLLGRHLDDLLTSTRSSQLVLKSSQAHRDFLIEGNQGAFPGLFN